jgi:hypothetical protein
MVDAFRPVFESKFISFISTIAAHIKSMQLEHLLTSLQRSFLLFFPATSWIWVSSPTAQVADSNSPRPLFGPRRRGAAATAAAA